MHLVDLDDVDLLDAHRGHIIEAPPAPVVLSQLLVFIVLLVLHDFILDPIKKITNYLQIKTEVAC